MTAVQRYEKKNIKSSVWTTVLNYGDQVFFFFFCTLSLSPAFAPIVTTNQRHSYGERRWPLKRSSWIWPARSPSVLESGNSWRHFTSGFWWGSKHACRDFGELRLSFFASNFALCRSRKFTAVAKVSLAVLFFNQFDFSTVKPRFADRLDFYRRESFCCVVTATELVQGL